MKKFKMTKFEVDGKEYEVKDIQDVIPSLVDINEIRGGVGSSNFDWISDKCEKNGCEGRYEYSLKGGGTCSICGHKVPCF